VLYVGTGNGGALGENCLKRDPGRTRSADAEPRGFGLNRLRDLFSDLLPDYWGDSGKNSVGAPQVLRAFTGPQVEPVGFAAPVVGE
jgi:hypothetical protein